ncbi:hypothetical protein BGZ73_002592 [Actinomortierella ambigua]|nr:hypothetical protein BGZ73_002592 [Actinomortierella ambigua]
MEWIVDKTGEVLNSYASVIDDVAQIGSKLESTLSPTANSLIRGFLGNDVLTAGFFVMVVGTVLTFLRNKITAIIDDIMDWFYVSVEVDENDMCYDWLNAVWGSDDNDWFQTEDKFDEDRPELVFMPGTGSHVLYHKGHKITVSRERPDSLSGANVFSNSFMSSLQVRESLTISTFGRDVSLLKSIILDAMEESYTKNSGKTSIYCCQGSDRYWSYMGARTPRAFHTVILAKGIKEALLDDISTFRRSAGWYRERGIPYRRGYLLHGPPGTGKTSFIIALAGHLGLSVCILNLSASGLDDQQLDQLMNDAPRNAIILIEDIDAALVEKKPGETQAGKNNVTLSGLLNALDGVTAHEGSIMFMTTNHIKKLAPALIRPGRCDRKLLFDYADSHQVREMFLRFFLHMPSDFVETEKPKNTNEVKATLSSGKLSLLGMSKGNSGDEKDVSLAAVASDPEEEARRLEHDAMIRRQANRIAELITKEDAITPAQLQGFFLQHRNEPEIIHNKVEAFKLELVNERIEQAEKKKLLRERRQKKEAKEKAKKEKERAKKEKERAKKMANGEDVDSSDSSSDEEDKVSSRRGSGVSDSDDDEEVRTLLVANGKAVANGKSSTTSDAISS